MIVDKNNEGYYVLSETLDGVLISRCYLYYTKKEAIRLFKKTLKEIKEYNDNHFFNKKS